MDTDNQTRFDQNIKRIDIGALVTVANISTNKREHYYISTDDSPHPSRNEHSNVHTVRPDEPIAKALIGKMKGDKVFFRHNLIIEFIEWPSS